MIREQLIEYFRGKGHLLVKLLVGQTILIGVLTFFCLALPGDDDFQAQPKHVIDQDAFLNTDNNIKATAKVNIVSSIPNGDKELTFHVLGYFLHFLIQFASGLLLNVCGLLKYILLAHFLAFFLFIAFPFVFKFTPWIQRNLVFLPFLR